MRCTPVGEWNTKRGAYRGGRRDVNDSQPDPAVAAQPDEADDEEIDAVRKPEQKVPLLKRLMECICCRGVQSSGEEPPWRQPRGKGFFSQLPYKCHHIRLASVGD